ncbi:MAG: hypothetical protein ACK4ST_09020 [Elioraea tepidiphila]
MGIGLIEVEDGDEGQPAGALRVAAGVEGGPAAFQVLVHRVEGGQQLLPVGGGQYRP